MAQNLSSLNSPFWEENFCALTGMTKRPVCSAAADRAAAARCAAASFCAARKAGISTDRACARTASPRSPARSWHPTRLYSERSGKNDLIRDILYIPRGRGGIPRPYPRAARRGARRRNARGGRRAAPPHYRASDAAPSVARAGRADAALLRKELLP